MARAKEVYEDLCSMLDARGWKHKRHDDNMIVTFGVIGDDLPMDFVVGVDVERQLIRLISKLPFTVPEDKRMDLAIATGVASYRLVDGSFNYDIAAGSITFRLTASFRESKIGPGLFTYLVNCACSIVDMYNDKFLAISKGYTTIGDFIKEQKGN